MRVQGDKEWLLDFWVQEEAGVDQRLILWAL